MPHKLCKISVQSASPFGSHFGKNLMRGLLRPPPTSVCTGIGQFGPFYRACITSSKYAVGWVSARSISHSYVFDLDAVQWWAENTLMCFTLPSMHIQYLFSRNFNTATSSHTCSQPGKRQDPRRTHYASRLNSPPRFRNRSDEPGPLRLTQTSLIAGHYSFPRLRFVELRASVD